ncbi:hypothetical protein G0R83_004805 [Salmonella enterica]|nr:hypothetical protein [Salmonella enterica]EEF8367289.1 hypothetical protein [Salmonella enterica]EEI4534831.1 hypothetical protein [Salmonella enterica]
MTLKASRNAISSPGSASGLTPCAAPDGLTVAPSGRVPAPASRSASRENAGDSTTPATCGPHGFTLYRSAALTLSLVNKLQARTASHGSTLYNLTWKRRNTPSQLSIFALRASVRRTSDSAFFWVADAAYKQYQECLPGREESHCPQSGRSPAELTGYCLSDGVAHTNDDSSKRRLPERADSQREAVNGSAGCGGTDNRTCPVNGYWRDADWLFCRDGKWRPVKPGLKPLVNGTPGRVGQLRAYGNAIVAPVAEAFIRAYMEAVTQ